MVAHQSLQFSISAAIVPLALTVVLFATTAGGVQHIVGDSIWSIPPSTNFYNNWSSTQTFHEGDFLYFDFESEMYNVLQVSRNMYRYCEKDILIPIGTYNQGPALVGPLGGEGEYFYLCNWLDYCDLGLRLIVEVRRSQTT